MSVAPGQHRAHEPCFDRSATQHSTLNTDTRAPSLNAAFGVHAGRVHGDGALPAVVPEAVAEDAACAARAHGPHGRDAEHPAAGILPEQHVQAPAAAGGLIC